jgi:predicted nucleic acid-binding protein
MNADESADPSQPTFFDSNVLIYTDDAWAPKKRKQALALLTEHQRRGTAVYSVQVLQEYFSATTRKLGVDAALAQQKVEVLARERIVRLNEYDVIAAIELHRLRRISFWDALIVHAARLANCSVLYSEDMIGGGQIGNVRIFNPFV